MFLHLRERMSRLSSVRAFGAVAAVAMTVACARADSVVDASYIDYDSADHSAAERNRIETGFQSLGMPEARSKCYADRIDKRLDGDRLALAADIVSDAGHKRDVKHAVMAAGPDMQNAFLYANLGC